MVADLDSMDALRVHTLRDALEIGLDLLELFAGVDCCAIWLGGDAGVMRDFVICTEDRGRDVDRVLRYGMLSATLLDDVTRAVLWRTVDDLTEATDLAEGFFTHQQLLASIDVELVDEIALRGDELRSLAVTSFADPPDWDDVTASLDPASEVPWPPWSV